MKKITIVLLLLSQLSLFAQDYKFGKVSKAALEERFYQLDSARQMLRICISIEELILILIKILEDLIW
jgi:hypothetical protein